MKKNDRMISVVAKEVLDDLNSRFSITIPPEGFGENILVEKVGDCPTWLLEINCCSATGSL